MAHNFSAYYYDHPYDSTCRSKVISCVAVADGYAIRLERTCFYPEGGGQPGDTGVLVPECADDVVRVKATMEQDGVSVHYTDSPLPPGTEVEARIDWERRYDFMQQHSAEHIFSGLVNRYFGYDNVGFHMNESYMTFDFNGDLSEEDISMLEIKVNRAIRQNIEIETAVPKTDLSELTYRSKLELTGEVRLVHIPGFDRCACCGLHVARTGEVGVFKVIDRMTYKGGVRLTALAGMRAVRDYGRKHQLVRALMSELSKSETDILQAVRDLSGKLTATERMVRNRSALAARLYAAANPDRLIIWFTDVFDAGEIKFLAPEMAAKAQLGAAILTPLNAEEYTMALAGETIDVKSLRKHLAPFDFRGGGKNGLVQGKLKGTKEDIQAALKRWSNV